MQIKPGLRQLFRRIGVPTTVSYVTSHGSVRLSVDRLIGSPSFGAQRPASNVYSNFGFIQGFIVHLHIRTQVITINPYKSFLVR